jgi:tape measure domain-containing protein
MPTVRHLITRWGFKADTVAVDRFQKSIINTKTSIGGAVLGLYAMQRAFRGLFGIADQFEQTKLVFDGFAKTTEESAKNLADVYDYIRRMPVEMDNVLMIAQKVQTHGLQDLGLMNVVGTIGNLSSAFGNDPRKIQDLLKAISDIKSAGKLMGGEFKQLLNVSLPILHEMRKELGDGTVEKFKQLMQSGNITFEQFWDQFTKLAGKGSKFEQLLIDKAETFVGLRIIAWNNIKMILGEASKELLPNFKIITKEILSFIQMNEKLIKTNVVAYMKSFGNVVMDVKNAIQATNSVLEFPVKQLGGWPGVIEKAYKALLIFLGYKGLEKLGKVGYRVGGIILFLGRVFKHLGKAFKIGGLSKMISQLRVLAGILTLINLNFVLIGATIAGILLLIEDISKLVKGKKSLIGYYLFGDGKEGVSPESVNMRKKEYKDWFEGKKKQLQNLQMRMFKGILERRGYDVRNRLGDGSSASSNVNIDQVNITVPENTPTAQMPQIISRAFNDAVGNMMKQSVNNNTTTAVA